MQEVAGPTLSVDFNVPIREVFGGQVLYQLWEEMGDFRQAFLAWADQLTEGYDRAVALGVLPTTHDLSPDWEGGEDGALRDRAPGYESLQAALLQGDGALGARALARIHNLPRSTVYTVANRLGVKLLVPKNEMRVATEDLIRDGVSQPRRIIAELERLFPGAQLPRPNTISNWKRRMTEGVAA